MKQTRAGDRIYPVPRCRRRNDTAKIKPVNGLRVEIFSLHISEKILPVLDRLNSRNGVNAKINKVPLDLIICFDYNKG
jgi:hypothetical protein